MQGFADQFLREWPGFDRNLARINFLLQKTASIQVLQLADRSRDLEALESAIDLIPEPDKSRKPLPIVSPPAYIVVPALDARGRLPS